ncbi:Signal transduction histidine kinase [Trichlorobacter thiogenes]|uniref:histidine kinase n=1 Tax=Trichlorobacter thiogenes TaxID=115783 RepID=A0A1T4M3Q1_9BACT|nr:hybrid sensor histidine kinase/response regulator [Trichlorobacter thiogenes]SJZ61619.1 Signal transduction histidine kinase [Trichlorobacter thiogenes]
MPNRSGQQLVILVVDDELVIRDLCSKGLRKYRILQAGSLQEALDCYTSQPVDLVLTDIQMPGGSGIDLLRRIKQIDPNALVLVMTGFGDKETVLEALRADADDFIQKPVNLLHLQTAIEKALSRRALKEELAAMQYLDSLKGAFLSLVSHKLKTPLTSLSLGLEELERYASRLHQTEACHLRLASMREDLGALSGLMTSLVRMHQALGAPGSGQVSCDLSEVVKSTAESVERASAKSGITLTLDLEAVPAVRGNRDRLIFALQQILENAFKFTSEGGSVAIGLASDGQHATIIVRDSGCGIAEDELPKIFERFYQVDPDATGQIPGFGLGLFCAREIIRQHGGSIALSSQPGQGTTVTINLSCLEE